MDIRDFPVELRLTCLEAVLLQMATASATAPALDRFTEVSAIGLGLEPTSTAALAFLPPHALLTQIEASVVQDERLHLLALSSVTGAKGLSRPRLLVLTACLRQLPESVVSGKALASVLRLITHQVCLPLWPFCNGHFFSLFL